ncbi:hypothetical protein [Streptomyces smyrnaeus]|uniref:hypothetical protein n=1 Tax=Streptomyces smyrnaeus TaxID=1387713 RepID=UPI003408D3CC
MSGEAIEFHWLATISVGSMRMTREGTIGAIPGMHTRQSTVLALIKGLKEQHGDNLVVLFLSLEPNELPGAPEAGGR